MKIKKGLKYVCIKEVVMDTGQIEYYKGVIYNSDVKNCITDESGQFYHKWSKQVKKYFVELK